MTIIKWVTDEATREKEASTRLSMQMIDTKPHLLIISFNKTPRLRGLSVRAESAVTIRLDLLPNANRNVTFVFPSLSIIPLDTEARKGEIRDLIIEKLIV